MDSSKNGAGSVGPDSPSPSESRRSTGLLLATLTLVQFYHFMDFVAAIPLGPDFARDLNFNANHLGWIGGLYTLTAALSGFLFAFFPPRLPKKTILVSALVTLGVTTFLFAYATSLEGLLLARSLSGLAAGPAVAAVLALVTESFPPDKRGSALGTVMISFSISTLAGIPAMLELSHQYGWRPVFSVLGVTGLLIAGIAAFTLPSSPFLYRKILKKKDRETFTFSRQEKTSLLLSASAMASTFLIVPLLAQFIQTEGGVSRESFARLLLLSGFCSILFLPAIGRWTDRKGGLFPMLALSLLFVLSLALGLAPSSPPLPAPIFFIGFTLAQTGRALVANTLSTKLTPPENAFRFQSLQTSVQHLASAFGAILSTRIVVLNENGTLFGWSQLAALSCALSLVPLYAAWRIENK